MIGRELEKIFFVHPVSCSSLSVCVSVREKLVKRANSKTYNFICFYVG